MNVESYVVPLRCHMPKETGAKAPNRWEGTQTYLRGNPTKTRARTAAQVKEEVAQKLRADREKRKVEVEKIRRNTIASFPPTDTIDISGEGIEEVFFDATNEEMPGSNNKKRVASGTTPEMSAPMEQDGAQKGPDQAVQKGVDPAMLALLMSIKEDINGATREAVDKIDKRIDDNERAIQKVGADTAQEIKKLSTHFEEAQANFETRLEKKLEERDSNVERRLMALETRASKASRSNDTSSPTPKQEEAYNKARRSLKIWPVAGPDTGDALKVFLRTKLRVDNDRIDSLGTISIKHAAGKTARDRSEIIATFESREDRDFIKSLGVNLANQKGVGMAIHVPGHLLDNYYALSSLGYNIRQNQEGVKRAIKFDDSIQDVFLDICIGGNWRRVLPKEARAALKASPAAISTSTGRSIATEDLVSLVQGDAVPGLTAVEVPADGMEEQNSQ